MLTETTTTATPVAWQINTSAVFNVLSPVVVSRINHAIRERGLNPEPIKVIWDLFMDGVDPLPSDVDRVLMLAVETDNGLIGDDLVDFLVITSNRKTRSLRARVKELKKQQQVE